MFGYRDDMLEITLLLHDGTHVNVETRDPGGTMTNMIQDSGIKSVRVRGIYVAREHSIDKTYQLKGDQ